MTRVLLIVALVIAIVLAVRRAIVETLREGRRSPTIADKGRKPRAPAPPQKLVCGVCGHEFDPEATGYICPECGK